MINNRLLILMVGGLLLLFLLPLVNAITVGDCFQGGNITIDGAYCVNSFYQSDTFNLTSSLLNASVLVVAGGGGGGWNMGGGGGAGGLNETLINLTTMGNITVTIGAGGANHFAGLQAYDGENSSFGGLINTTGGGGGGGYSGSGGSGRNGGSGGGAGYDNTNAGLGTTGQGYSGGTKSAGGGGYGSVGNNGGTGGSAGGNGGSGYTSGINGTSVCYAGGGGGGVVSTGGSAGVGTCGGGNGGKGATQGTVGLANTGGGGGGGSNTGGSESGYGGGSGIVVVRYLPTIVFAANYSTTTYETSLETFTLNVTANGGAVLTANFVYDGTTYAATKTGDDNSALFTNTINIPTVTGVTNKNLHWIVYYNSTPVNSNTYTQTVNAIQFNLCNSTLIPSYINFTFKDEDTNTFTNASLTSSFIVYLGNGGVTKTFTYQSTPENPSYAFCTNTNTSTLFVTPSLQYYNSVSILRTYNYPSPITLTNSVTNKILYMLKTANGIYSSYQVVNQVSSIIQNALVTFTLNNNIVETKLTDGSGLATFFLNPNTAYNLTASKNGYNSFSTVIYPTQSTYTITLSSISAGNITSYNNGVNYTINPNLNYLLNATVYNFNATLTSSFLNIDSWGFNITNGTTVVATQMGTGGLGNLGTVSINFNTDDYVSLNAVIFWTVNGTTTTATKIYTMEGLSGTDWSINNFNNDLKSYIKTGFFGLTPIGLNIIIFVVILLTVGIVSWKFGVSSPLVISLILFFLVLIFDIFLKLITYPSGFGQGLATITVGSVTLALAIKEVTSF